MKLQYFSTDVVWCVIHVSCLQSSSATISAPPTANFKAGSSTAPVKPTFPSAAAALSNNSPVHSGATITGAPQIKKPESSSGLTSKLIHPEEDISLVSSCMIFILFSVDLRAWSGTIMQYTCTVSILHDSNCNLQNFLIYLWVKFSKSIKEKGNCVFWSEIFWARYLQN